MSNNISAEKMAEMIKEIYSESFGGKKRGRFQISRSQFRRLGGRKRLNDTFVYEVAEACLEIGYILIITGDIIAIIEENIVSNYRNVPKSIVRSYENEDEDNDEASLEDFSFEDDGD
jgi:hypothetical protein